MPDDGFSEWLAEFGFTDKEILIYDELLAQGQTTANDLAEEVEVSRRHVYTILERLEARGFIEINDYLEPAILRPAPPDAVYNRWSTALDELRTGIESRYREQIDPGEGITLVKSRDTAIKRLEGLIQGAEELLLLGGPAPVVEMFGDDLARAVDRGVLVLLLLTGVEDPSDLDVDIETIAHAARIPPTDIALELSVDRNQSLISHERVITNPGSNKSAIVLNDPDLQEFVYGMFLHVDWQEAREAYVTQPDGLPATYSNFFHAVIQATLRQQNGEQLGGVIEARPVDGGNPVHLEGEIVGVDQQLIEPKTTESTLTSIKLLLDDGRTVTLGGPGAYVEDYRALTITLEDL